MVIQTFGESIQLIYAAFPEGIIHTQKLHKVPRLARMK